jgi:hypothetical protein
MADEIELLRLVGELIPEPTTDAWARAKAAIAAAREEDLLSQGTGRSGRDLRTPAGVTRRVARRWRRRVKLRWAAAVAAALAAGAVAASVALLPAGHPAGHPASGPAAQLAAWTVTRQADGSIQVTFREMSDAAGLQRVLRADGVPASVTFPGTENPACRNLPTSHPRLGQTSGLLDGVVSLWPHHGRLTSHAFVIYPAALPSGAGLALFYPTPAQIRTFHFSYLGPPMFPAVGLVQASPRCTGS